MLAPETLCRIVQPQPTTRQAIAALPSQLYGTVLREKFLGVWAANSKHALVLIRLASRLVPPCSPSRQRLICKPAAHQTQTLREMWPPKSSVRSSRRGAERH